MFFLLSKILVVFLKPLNWVGLFLLLALFSPKAKWRRRSLQLSTIFFFFFSNHFILNQVINWWEPETITADQIEEPYDIGIVLGGYSNSLILPSHDRHNFNNRGNRFFNAYELYRTRKIKKFLLTGGSGHPIENRPKEANEMYQYLLRIGVPDSLILVEAESRNTYENAVFSAELLQEQSGAKRALLLTSAWHLPRAAACFRKTGITFTPYGVDYLSEKTRWVPDSLLFPYRNGFNRWELLIKEWVGYWMYSLKGYL
ncbi:MAG: YdcF family protein [Bacteroidota bacterium]